MQQQYDPLQKGAGHRHADPLELLLSVNVPSSPLHILMCGTMHADLFVRQPH